MQKTCPICGNNFSVYPSGYDRKTCSRECSKISQSIATKGRPKSEEHKRKISLAHSGKKRPPFSKEWRDNLSKARKGRKFTLEHRRNIGDSQRGEKGNNWQGGKTEQRKNMSFSFVRQPNHPHANNRGYIRKHRFIMENHLGRFLTPEEVVHHINGNPTDDRIENLMLFPCQKDHAFYHAHLHKLNK